MPSPFEGNHIPFRLSSKSGRISTMAMAKSWKGNLWWESIDTETRLPASLKEITRSKNFATAWRSSYHYLKTVCYLWFLLIHNSIMMVINRPFFSEFFGRANRALSSQFYRARRKNSEPGKKNNAGWKATQIVCGRAGVVRRFARKHLGMRSDIKITCKCTKRKKNNVTDQ